MNLKPADEHNMSPTDMAKVIDFLNGISEVNKKV